MRTLVATIVIGLAAICICFAQANSWQEDELHGKVKSVTVERAELTRKTGAVVEGRRRPAQSASYAASGQKTEESHFSSSGALLWTFLFSYDEIGRRTSTECRLAKGQTSQKLIFSYASNDRKDKSVAVGAKGVLQEQSLYSYDDQGNNIEIANLTADGSSIGRWVYTYDSAGHMREWIAYDAQGEVSEDSTYSYDSEGRLKIATQYGPADLVVRKATFDSKRNEIEVEKYSDDGALVWKRQYEYSYDEEGNWIKKVTKELHGAEGYTPVEVEYRALEYY